MVSLIIGYLSVQGCLAFWPYALLNPRRAVVHFPSPLQGLKRLANSDPMVMCSMEECWAYYWWSWRAAPWNSFKGSAWGLHGWCWNYCFFPLGIMNGRCYPTWNFLHPRKLELDDCVPQKSIIVKLLILGECNKYAPYLNFLHVF
jgi:hypothetical protein